MFVLMSGMAEARSLLEVSVEKRMKSMLGKSGISITITSITNLLAFGVGATSVFISIRNFCIYTGQGCRHVGYLVNLSINHCHCTFILIFSNLDLYTFRGCSCILLHQSTVLPLSSDMSQ